MGAPGITDLDWPGLYQRIGALVEQNATLFKRTDDHEGRIRGMESKLTDLDEKVDDLGGKVDRLDGKVDQLSESVRVAMEPKPGRWERFRAWLSERANGVVVAALSAVGTGVGGYIIAFLQHR